LNSLLWDINWPVLEFKDSSGPARFSGVLDSQVHLTSQLHVRPELITSTTKKQIPAEGHIDKIY
jgi:hypothetical protein